MTRPISRREALLAGSALVFTGCGALESRRASRSGSTLGSTWRDVRGVGALTIVPGEQLITRTELGPRRQYERVLATFAHVTDAHVLDPSSPARVTFLDRLGDPFESTFRPQETLTGQVLAGAVRAIRALRPDAVIQGGDLIDNDQSNELSLALSVLHGGRAQPGSGPNGYFGVQLASDPDPFYYRPDLDAPRHPRLLQRATRPFISPGLGARCCPVLGDHDLLVAGEVPPSAQTRELALGDQAVWALPPGLKLPPGMSVSSAYSPDGPPERGLVDLLLARALAGPMVRVPADPRRREMDAGEVLRRLRTSSGLRAAGETLDYNLDVGEGVRLVVLDLARREGGSGGLVRPGQAAWLESALAGAGQRWIVVISHQPLESSERGEQLLEVLDADDRVIAALSGHTHRNRIVPRARSSGRGYWMISTSSLIDYPQQARALRVVETVDGSVAILTWMLDHVDSALGQISRELSYLDAQGGRPKGFAGSRADRNAALYRAGA